MATTQQILGTISALEKQLASLKDFMESNGGALPSKKAKKEKKERDPDAPPRAENPYFAFLNGRIRPLLKGAAAEGEKQPGTVPVFFAKHLMSLNPESKEAAYALSDEEILAAYRDWATPENLEAAKPVRKAKSDAGSDAGSVADAEPKAEKPKRVLSDEQKAKMKAGREAAKAKKDAEKAASAEAEPEAPKPAAEPTSAAEAPKPKFAKKEVKKAPTYTLEQLQDWKELEYEGGIYGYNVRGDTIDGEGEFVGHWDGKALNREASLPADWDKVMA
jgi:hypothetical protein